MTSYYDVLHLKADAGQLEIKQAYFQSVRKYPPDRYPDEFMKIREAYETLSNVRARRQYDEINALSRTESLFYREAEKAMGQGDYRQAIRLLEQMIKYFPDHAIVRQKLGDSYSSNGNSGKASAVFERLVRDEPDHAGYAGKLANAYMQRGWYRKAITQFHAAIALDQDNLSLWINLIRCQMDSQEYLEAARTADQALAASRQSGMDPLELYYLIVSIDIITFNRDSFRDHIEEMKQLALSSSEQRDNVAWFLTHLAKLVKSGKWKDQHALLVNAAFELCPENDEIRQVKLQSEQEAARQILLDQLEKNENYDQVFFSLLDFETNRCLDPDCAHCQVTQFELEIELVMEADRLRSQLIRLRNEYPDLYRMKQNFFNEICNPRRYDRLIETYRKRYDKLKRAYPEEFEDQDEDDNEVSEEEDWEDTPQSTQLPAVRDADKVGRNDPCPCGSGKKYKKCCGK